MVYFLLITILLALVLVVYTSRTTNRLLEQWINPPPPIDLATNKQFQTFITFHGTICDMWNEVVQKSMESDQTTLSKADFIQQMEQTIQPPVTLIQCASTISATTDPTALLQEIPTTIDPYKNTLTFLMTKTTDMLTKLEGGLQGAIEQFAPFQATVTCNNGTCNGQNITCTLSGAGSDPGNQQALLQQVLDRIGPILEAEPDIQPLYAQAQVNIAKLKDYSEQAQNGTLVNQVNLPTN